MEGIVKGEALQANKRDNLGILRAEPCSKRVFGGMASMKGIMKGKALEANDLHDMEIP